MTQALHERVQLDEHGCVERELACVGCGYLLLGMTPRQRCPECGLVVRRSIAAQQLATWPISWLTRLQRGIALLIAAGCIGWLFMACWTLVTIEEFSFILPVVEGLGLLRFNYGWVLVGMVVLSVALGLAGAMMITFSDAARALVQQRSAVRWLARLGLAVALFSLILMIGLFLGTTRWTPLHSQLFWCWVGMFIAGSVGVWNVWSYLAAIAQRAADQNTAQHCIQMRVLSMIVAVLLFSNACILWPLPVWLGILTRLALITANVILDWTMLLGRIVFLVVAFFGTLLLIRCRRIVADR